MSIDVVAELEFRDTEKHVRTFLLGADGALYFHHDLELEINPFCKEAHILADRQDTDYVIEHSKTKYEDGHVDVGEGYYHGRTN